MTAEEIIRHNRWHCIVFDTLRAAFLGNAVVATWYLAVGLTQAQIFLLQTILCVVSIASDMPFGYLADRIGIRKVMIIGSVIMVAQSMYFTICRSFWQFAIALVGTGLYLAALQNTANALMTRSLKQLEDRGEAEAQYEHYLIKSGRYSNLAYACGSLVGGAIATVGGLAMPYYLQPVVWLLALVVTCRLIEPPVRERTQHADFEMLIKALRMMLVDSKSIRYMIVMYSVFRLHAMLCFWLLQPRMAQGGVPQEVYGLVYFVWGLLVAGSSGMLPNVKAETSTWLWVRVIITCSLGAYLAAATTNVLGFLALMVGLTLISSLVERLFNEYMHRALPDDGVMRNTELSIASTIPTLVYAIAAPFFGGLVEATSLATSFMTVAVVCGLITSVSFVLFRRSVLRH